MRTTIVLLSLCALLLHQGRASGRTLAQQDTSVSGQGARTEQNGQLPCNPGASPGSVGGYQPVTDQDELSSIKKNLAPLAFQKYTFTHNLTGCSARTMSPGSYSIMRACKQVVAGTNYAFEFGITYKCTTASNVATSGLLTLNSLVYQPLPASQNSNPQVTKVWNVSSA